MEKKRKTYDKKQPFAAFFLKVFVPFVLVASMLGAFATYLLVSMYHTGAENIVDRVNDQLQSELSQEIINYNNTQITKGKFISDAEYTCEMMSRNLSDQTYITGGAVSLYARAEDGTLSLIAGHDDRVFFVILDKNKNQIKLSCTYADFQKMTKDVPESPDGYKYLTEIKDVYVNGTSFWLGKYSYEIFDGKDTASGSAPIKKQVTVTEIPAGYKKLDTSLGYEFFDSSLTYPANTIHTIDYSDHISSLIAELSGTYKTGIYAGTRRKCAHGTHNTTAVRILSSYYLVFDYHTDLMRSVFGKLIIATWIVIITISVLIPLAIAYAMYQSYRSAYDMEHYRRTASNAMAHDLKSPLAVISLYAENLKSGSHPEKNGYYIDGILDEVSQMNAQIAAILDMAKAENIDTKLDMTDVDISELITAAADSYMERLKEKDITFSMTGHCTVHADRALMQQAVTNLMDNAANYAADDGTIIVTLSDSRITFFNTCDPIDPETLKAIWDPFVKGDNSRHGHKGTGLGLSIVRTIMKRHGFECRMQNVQNGVEVTLILAA